MKTSARNSSPARSLEHNPLEGGDVPAVDTIAAQSMLRQLPQAEKECQEALRLRLDLPKVHLKLGLVDAVASQWDKAEEALPAETKPQPGNAEAEYRLGNARLQPGRAKEARAELKRADTLQPEMPETLYSFGNAAALEGDNASAEKHGAK